jgi:hypothetical protein
MNTNRLFRGLLGGLVFGLGLLAGAATAHNGVSLAALGRQVRAALARGADPASLQLGNLADVTGYRLDEARKDIEVIGIPANSATRPIAIARFVGALRVAHYRAIGMTLLPRDRLRPDSVHVVHAFPPELHDTALLAPMIAADYDIKRRAYAALATYYRHAKAPCVDAGTRTVLITSARIVFLPAKPDLAFERGSGGTFVWVRHASVLLRPEGDLMVAGGGTRPAPPDPGLRTFAADFTRRFPEHERLPVYRDLAVTFRLFLLAQLLRAEELEWNAAFWLTEFPLPRHPTPRELPGFEPKKVRRTCWGEPYEYTATRVERQIWGGVLISYGEFTGRAAILSAELPLGASVGGSLAPYQTVQLTDRALPDLRISVALPVLPVLLPGTNTPGAGQVGNRLPVCTTDFRGMLSCR